MNSLEKRSSIHWLLKLASCKLCGSPAKSIGSKDASIACINTPSSLSGELIEYFSCTNCGLVQTYHFDTFTTEDWANKIYNKEYITFDPDYGSTRALINVEPCKQIIQATGLPCTTKLDYGSGSGVFARELGATEYDPYSYSKRPEGTFDLVTCFEVAEHSTTPRELFADINSLLHSRGLLILSTLAAINPTISNWYLAPRNGHVTMYTPRSLEILAYMNGLEYQCLTPSTHIFFKLD